MNEEPKNYYSSHRALTHGIHAFAYRKDFWLPGRKPRNCHTTIEEARAHAEFMRIRRIEALRKQITKLEALTF